MRCSAFLELILLFFFRKNSNNNNYYHATSFLVIIESAVSCVIHSSCCVYQLCMQENVSATSHTLNCKGGPRRDKLLYNNCLENL